MPVLIESICQRTVDTVSTGDSIACAADRMRQRTVGSLIVVDGAKHPVGIITDRDLVIRALAGARDPDLTSVIEVMTPDIVVATGEMPVSSALQIMRDGPFRRLPVVDREGVLVGLVTLDDILMRVARDLSEIGALLEGETPAAAQWLRPVPPGSA